MCDAAYSLKLTCANQFLGGKSPIMMPSTVLFPSLDLHFRTRDFDVKYPKQSRLTSIYYWTLHALITKSYRISNQSQTLHLIQTSKPRLWLIVSSCLGEDAECIRRKYTTFTILEYCLKRQLKVIGN